MSVFDRFVATLLILCLAFFVLREAQFRAGRAEQRLEIVVSVSGAVVRPGVLRLPAQARAVHAVDRCGGLTSRADRDALELARPLKDGDHLVVASLPSLTQPPEASPSALRLSQTQRALHPIEQTLKAPSSLEAPPDITVARPKAPKPPREKPPSALTGPLDINRASLQELDLLPGVGPVLAERIVSARETAPGGTFSSLEELETIRGIKGKTLLRLRPHLKLERP